MLSLTIDNRTIECRPDASVLDAAREAGIYIPTLCSHPDLPAGCGAAPSQTVYRGAATRIDTSSHEAFSGCRLCLVEADGAPAQACHTPVRGGLVVRTDSPQIRGARQDSLARILAIHPHACLMCPNREGCDRLQCSLNVPPKERCCSKFAYCEVRRVSDYVGIKPDTPRFVYENLPDLREEPLFTRDYNLCIGCARCVRACAQLRGVGALGFVNSNGRAIVGSLQSTLPESDCKFCTACVEVCPTGTLMDKRPVVRGKTAAPLVTGGEREHALVPCRAACPAMTDVPRYVRLVAEGKYAEATAVIRERAPFPGVLGYVCFHPCEDACRRGEVNEAVSICALKRFAAENDTGLWKQNLARPKPTGKRVAIVGSGPAGLTAAYFLARRGHAVTVFEAAPEAGGMMRYGIPRHRLPREVLDKEIAEIAAQGVEIRTQARIGGPISLGQLRRDSDALFLAVGASLSKRISVEGSELDGVLWGVDFLRDAAQNAPPAGSIGDGRVSGQAPLGRVIVIGGGNVAIDVAMTARRLGARDVQLACLERREEMPAFEAEIAEAEAEGIRIHTSWGPKQIRGAGDRVAGIEMKRCSAVFDDAGRFNPRYDESATTSFDCDTVILAIGQTTDLTFLDGTIETRGAGIRVESATLATNVPGIFAGGEVAVGPSSVVSSIAAGRRAAMAIDKYLGGAGEIEEKLVDAGYGTARLGHDGGFAGWPRAPMPLLPVADRVAGFALVALGYDAAQARREASRCLQCDLRLAISAPVLPPEEWLAFVADKIAGAPEADGVYRLLDADKNIIKISGVQNLRRALEEQLASNSKARYFDFEEERMYTQRESELLQAYLQQHGRMPEGNDELADLF